MVRVECDGCKSPYQVDEKRIPPNGLKMRCPKCGASFLVARPGGAEGADLPAPVARKAPPVPPRAAPPRGAPPPPDPHADLPAPAAGPPRGFGQPQRAAQGFGEIDLAVDLPSAPPPNDLPAVGGGGGGFGVIDLPAVPGAAPPQPRKPTQQGFGAIDLPNIPGPPQAARPPPAQRPRTQVGGFGEIDLPMPSGPQPPATKPSSSIDLPMPVAGGVGLPARSTGGVGLPSPAGAGLPMPAGVGLPAHAGVGLPSPVHAGLPSPAGAGLPMASGAGLPSPVHAGLPSPATAGLPSPATALGMPSPLGDGSLPSPMGQGMLPTPMGQGMLPTHMGQGALPSPMGQGMLPSPMGHGALPSVLGGQSLPMPIEGGGLPAHYDQNELPMPGKPSNAPLALPGEEIALGDAGAPLGAGLEGLSGVGDEVDLATLGGSPELAAQPGQARRQERPGEPLVEIQPKKSNVPRYVAAGVVVAALGGGALALLPDVGPFGFYVISDAINSSRNASLQTTLRQSVQNELDADTSVAAQTALGLARAAVSAAPRHRETAAYAAYVALSRTVRFGRKADDEQWGKQQLQQATSKPSDMLTLANAALDATTGQLARARQALATLAQTAPNDVDVACLTGEVELLAKTPDKAVVAWKKAVEIKKSARTLYGLARAQLAAGDAASAEASAKAVTAASAGHVGARTLLAQIAWQKPDREQEAIDLLTKVTAADAKASASDAELVDAFTLLGRIHLQRSRMSAAEQAFGAALKLDSQSVQALVGAGELFYRAGRWSEAQAKFEAASAADADSVAAKVGVAKAWLSLERMKEAKDLLKKLRESKPNEPAVAYWLGRAEETLGNKKDAEQAYLAAIKVGGDRLEAVDAYVSLSYLLSSLGRNEEAAAKLAEASAKFPESASLHRAKGEVALATGRYEEAKAELEAALAKEEDLGTKFKLGVVWRRMRNFEEAGKIFDAVAAVDRNFPGLALERGLLFEETGQSERALEMYTEAQSKAPNDVDLKLRVGSTQVIAGHPEQAEKVLREVLKERPNSAEAFHFLGRALLLKGNLADSVRYLESAINQDPNRAEYWLFVGWASIEAGNFPRATEALKRALDLDRELGDAYWQRSVLLYKQGAIVDALADAQTALAKRPSRYDAWATIAMCLGEQRKWGEAIEAWKKAIAGNDKVAEWHFRLGKLQFDQGSAAAALPELDRALALATDPGRVGTAPGWMWQVHQMLGELRKTSDKAKACEHFQEYLRLQPQAVDRQEIERFLKSAGCVQR